MDVIKIDKSFVIDMLENKDSATIVRSIISLARAPGLKVVAEGVKSWKKLRALRCDMAQGYYLGKPLDVEGLSRLIGEWWPFSGKKLLHPQS